MFKEQETIKEFEDKFAQFVGTKYAVSLNSGFSALLIALKANKVGPGDEVIIPAYTFIATATAVSLAGAKPVLCDVLEDATLDPELIERLITPKTKAIIPVHLYARRANLERIQEIAKKHRLTVIEDCAEAIGTELIGKGIGCWSFHYAKTISTEQGGMITTNNHAFAELCRSLSGYAKSPSRDYLHMAIGYNFKMTSMQAAMGIKSLETIRPRLALMWFTGLQYAEKYNEPVQKNYWVFVSKNLAAADRLSFVPMYHQIPYWDTAGPAKFPMSEKLYHELKYVFLP